MQNYTLTCDVIMTCKEGYVTLSEYIFLNIHPLSVDCCKDQVSIEQKLWPFKEGPYLAKLCPRVERERVVTLFDTNTSFLRNFDLP